MARYEAILHPSGRAFPHSYFFFKAAVELDPRAISPHDEIQTLPDVPVLTALKEWSLRSFEA